MKQMLRDSFINALHDFLLECCPLGAIITIKEIKLWISALPESHALHAAWRMYAGNKPILQGVYAVIPYIPGFHRELITHKRTGSGKNVKYVKMHRNKVKILEK